MKLETELRADRDDGMMRIEIKVEPGVIVQSFETGDRLRVGEDEDSEDVIVRGLVGINGSLIIPVARAREPKHHYPGANVVLL